MKKQTRWVLWGVIALVGLGVLAAVANAVVGPKASVKTATVEGAALERRVSASGEVASRADIDLYSPLNGTVRTVYVRDQARVRRGQQVVLIDPAPFRVAVAQAYAAYLSAKASAHAVGKGEPTPEDYEAADAAIDAAYRAWWVARREFEEMNPTVVPGPSGTTTVPASYRELRLQVSQTYAAYQQAVAAKAKLDVASDAGIDHAAAGENVDQAYLAYLKAKDDLAKTCVRAPISGVIFLEAFTGTDLQGPPRKLTRYQAVTPQTALARIVDPTRMKFIADVDEADIAAVNVGKHARVSLDAFEGRELPGRVTRIALISKTTASGGSAFGVDILLPRGITGLRIGMNGTADIIVAKRRSALQIPIEAVTERDGDDVVFVIADGVARLRKVTLGFFTDTVYEVKKGLKAGEVVAVSGLDDLEDGMRVRVQD